MDRILKLIEKYKEEKQRAHKEYDKATKDIYKKYAFGRLQAYNRMIDDLSAVAEYPLREQANELLPDFSQQSELLLALFNFAQKMPDELTEGDKIKLIDRIIANNCG